MEQLTLTAARNQLDAPKKFAVATWLAREITHLRAKRATRDHAAALATAACGFPVGKWHIEAAENTIGQRIKPKAAPVAASEASTITMLVEIMVNLDRRVGDLTDKFNSLRDSLGG